MFTTQEQIFEQVKGLSGDAKDVVSKMFSQAGVGWMADAFYFDHTSIDLLGEACGHPVLDSNDVVVTILAERSFTELNRFMTAQGKGPTEAYRFGTPRISADEAVQLQEIRGLILEDLQLRGEEAADEYALLGNDKKGALVALNKVVKGI